MEDNLKILENISTLLFDLDNTLIFMDENDFVISYASNAALYFKDIFPNSKDFVYHLLEGTKYMVSTHNNASNIQKFFQYFVPKCNGVSEDELLKRFLSFYENDFDKVKTIVKTDKLVPKIFEKAIEKEFEIVIATDPLFPEIATLKRIKWAGLENFIEQIKLITYGEQFSTTKINIEYYEKIIELIDKKPSECLMIGNDLIKDGLASIIGMKFYHISNEKEEIEFYNNEMNDKSIKDKVKVTGSGTLLDFYELLRT